MNLDGSDRAPQQASRNLAGWAAMAVLFAVILTTCLLAAVSLHGEVILRHRGLAATARVFAASAAEGVATGDRAAQLLALRAVKHGPDIVYAALLDPNGRTTKAMGNPDAAFSGDARVLDVLTNATLPVTVGITAKGGLVGQAQVVAEASDLREHFALNLLMGLLAGAGTSLVTLLAFLLLRRRQTSILRQVEEAMDRLTVNPREDIVLDPRQGGEVAGLIERINSMVRSNAEREAVLAGKVRSLAAYAARLTAGLDQAQGETARANLATSDLLAAIGQEIRVLLTGITATANVLATSGLDQRHRHHAEVISKSGQSLLAVVNDMLDLSRVEGGGLTLERLPLDPAGIADDVVGLYWEAAAAKGLDLAVRVAPGLPMSVTGDPLRLYQIVSTLVANAVASTDRGQVLMTLRYEQSHLHYSVTDSGRGLTVPELAQIFEAGASTDLTSPRAPGRTGLGLLIGKHLAQAMGGDIIAQSVAGKGSHCTLRIPAPVLLPARPSPGKSEGLNSAGLAVDGAAMLSALGTTLAAAGYHVEVIETATATQNLIVADAARLETLQAGASGHSHVVGLYHQGDRRGEAALVAGTIQDLLTLPLRQTDIFDLLSRLKQVKGSSAQVSPASDSPRVFAGRRVLVADDNEINREVIIEALRQLGIVVESAADGREAVEVWRRTMPDLVFMDCSMPLMDGYAATREIRAREALGIAGRHTPVIALTAIVAGNDSGTWRESGMDAFMTKPFTLKTIMGCLEAHFAGLPPPVQQDAPPTVDPGMVLDPATINDLRNIGGNEALFHRVLDLFAGRVPQAIDKLHTMGREPDLQALADAAHALKSMCANIGAMRAVAACDDLELVARTRVAFDLGDKLSAIMREVRLTLNEVERLRAA